MRYCYVAVCDRPGSTAYSDLASKCVASFNVFGIEVSTISYNGEFGVERAWMRNTLRKPVSIFQHMVAKGDVLGCHPVWVMDADLLCLKDPLDLFLCEQYVDVAVMKMGVESSRDRMYSAGVVGFMPTTLGVATLSAWAGECNRLLMESKYVAPKRSWLYEQAALFNAITSIEPRVWEIPTRLHSIPGYAGYEAVGAVIEHLPASRELRVKVDAS